VASHFTVREIISMGGEILNSVEKNPAQHRIGNIYFKIQEKINKKLAMFDAQSI